MNTSPSPANSLSLVLTLALHHMLTSESPPTRSVAAPTTPTLSFKILSRPVPALTLAKNPAQSPVYKSTTQSNPPYPTPQARPVIDMRSGRVMMRRLPQIQKAPPHQWPCEAQRNEQRALMPLAHRLTLLCPCV